MGTIFGCANISNSLTATMPKPGAELAKRIEEYEGFLEGLFEKTYRNRSPLSTYPGRMPELTEEEEHRAEQLMRRIKEMPEWDEYTKQIKRWAIMM